MNMRPGRAHHEPSALDKRVLALEDRVSTIEEALRVLAHGLEGLPAVEPTARRTAEAARRAYDLMLVAGQHASKPDGRPAPDGPRGQ